MWNNTNFEEFSGETLQPEELPGIAGGIETYDSGLSDSESSPLEGIDKNIENSEF
jgi:hypothetical protein